MATVVTDETNFHKKNIFLQVYKELHVVPLVQKYNYYMHLKLSKVLKIIRSKSKIKHVCEQRKLSDVITGPV